MITKEKMIDKPFYLIAKFWLEKFDGFIKIGDDEEEIFEYVNDKKIKCNLLEILGDNNE